MNAEVEREPIDEEQLLQARFSDISKKSSSKFMSDSIRDSDHAVDNALVGQELD